MLRRVHLHVGASWVLQSDTAEYFVSTIQRSTANGISTFRGAVVSSSSMIDRSLKRAHYGASKIRVKIRYWNSVVSWELESLVNTDISKCLHLQGQYRTASSFEKNPNFGMYLQILVTIPHVTFKYRVRHKSVNIPLSHELLVVRTWLAVYSGWG
jgi:hypothetical protein